MPEHIKYEDDDLFNPETHHESSDVPVRPLFWFVVIFIVFAAVSHVALWFLYKAFVKAEQTRQDPQNTAVTRPADVNVPKNQPLLQPFPKGDVPPQRTTPVTDLEEMRAAEESALRNYGWVDRQKGIVRIPIDRAKELTAARLALQQVTGTAPSAAPAAPATAATTTAPAAATTTGGRP